METSFQVINVFFYQWSKPDFRVTAILATLQIYDITYDQGTSPHIIALKHLISVPSTQLFHTQS